MLNNKESGRKAKEPKLEEYRKKELDRINAYKKRQIKQHSRQSIEKQLHVGEKAKEKKRKLIPL